MIKFTPLDNTTPVANGDTAYQYFRFYLVLAAEKAKTQPYLDTQNIPTIGIGFNLKDPQILGLVMNQFGVTDITAQGKILKKLQTNYASNSALQQALNGVMADLFAAHQANRPTFTFSSGTAGETEMRSVFKVAVQIYDENLGVRPYI